MSIGQREKGTQKRVIKLFVQELGYSYLGDFTERKNSNIETELLTKFLTRKGYSPVLISRALKELQDAAGDQSVNLYDLNEQTYKSCAMGSRSASLSANIKLPSSLWIGSIRRKITFILPRKSLSNINALTGVVYQRHRLCGHRTEAQHCLHVGWYPSKLDQPAPGYDYAVFRYHRLVLAGNDSEGLRYGTTGTSEKYYLSWKEDPNAKDEVSVAVRAQIEKCPLRLDKNLISLCRKERLVELLHNLSCSIAELKRPVAPINFLEIWQHVILCDGMKVVLSGIPRVLGSRLPWCGSVNGSKKTSPIAAS